MRRFSLWLRGKPIVADSALAAILLLLEIVSVGNAHNKLAYLAVGVLLPLPVVLRRVYPRMMAVATLALSMTASLVGFLTEEDADHIALLSQGIILYTLVAYVGRREGLWFGLGLGVDVVLSIAAIDRPAGPDIVFTAMFYALSWTLAEFIGARHAYDAEVAARLAVADYDKERRAHDAVSAERTRIARELHDVVAHAVSVIIVQADGAKYALRRDPDAAEQALTTIASTGREALRELRRTVALLRTEHAPDQLPQHGTAGLAKVVEMMRGTGLAVELELTGELDDIAPEVSLGVHRIVQESLTNTLRHAGPHPKAWVRVRRTDSDVLIDVTDSGGVPLHEPATRIEGSGLGLVGMRERVAVLGGSMEAGPDADGAWRVHASIPLRPGSAECAELGAGGV
ncbi:sensor histidine kinase [Nocardia gipuzkoensis]|uniref:sensor histidine kinase n=1 Tax=Nocardia gipuzkoensis TaxID=2749991 RepID=UPI003EE3632B